jgi:hypothetical protein
MKDLIRTSTVVMVHTSSRVNLEDSDQKFKIRDEGCGRMDPLGIAFDKHHNTMSAFTDAAVHLKSSFAIQKPSQFKNGIFGDNNRKITSLRTGGGVSEERKRFLEV